MYVDDRQKRFYEEVLKNVGYINIRKVEEERYFTFPSDEKCKEALFNVFKDEFKVPLEIIEVFKDEFKVQLEIIEVFKDEFKVQLEIIEVFKDEAFLIFERTCGRHEGQLRYKTLILSFFGGKPNGNSNSMPT
ncbi:hypothetical protein TNCT_717731 [Trichonephila clavata]|uniref:Uncharacterized protein n=1 Tax=Trichonephila clavata TaxID=2740835 RepID=A0A8X6KUF3_TRICU|nr:hypothetical protein TNCT_717731 [Trichonephila clavata]